MKTLPKKRNVVLQIGHIERFNKAYIKLEELVKNPLFIECNRISPFKVRGTEVDVIMDLMIHDLDIILKLNKSKIKSIHAKGINVLTNNADIANARITFENDCVCNLSSSRISAKVERKMRVFKKMLISLLTIMIILLTYIKKLLAKNYQASEKKTINYEKNDSLKERN